VEWLLNPAAAQRAREAIKFAHSSRLHADKFSGNSRPGPGSNGVNVIQTGLAPICKWTAPSLEVGKFRWRMNFRREVKSIAVEAKYVAKFRLT